MEINVRVMMAGRRMMTGYYMCLKLVAMALASGGAEVQASNQGLAGITRRELSEIEKAQEVIRSRAAYEAFQRASDRLLKDDLKESKSYANMVIESRGGWDTESELILAIIALEEGNYARAISLTDGYWPDHEIPLRSLVRARAFLKIGMVEKGRRLWSWYSSPEKLIASEEDIVYKRGSDDFGSKLLIACSREVVGHCPLRTIKWLKPLGRLTPQNSDIALGMASALRILKREEDALPFLALAWTYGDKSDRDTASYRMQKFSPEACESALNRAKNDPASVYTQ